MIALNIQDEAVREAAEALYTQLVDAGVDVLFDDRQERPGPKFKDADLIGVPVRAVVGKRGLENGEIEVSLRTAPRERHAVAVADAADRLVELAS